MFAFTQRYLVRNCPTALCPFAPNCTLASQELKFEKQQEGKKFKLRCFNKGAHLNDWDYFLKNVLHNWHIYDNVDTKNNAQVELQG